jgi:hypothetical protein
MNWTWLMLQISGRGPIAIMHRFFFLGAILASAKDEDLFAVRPINQLHLQSGLHRSPVCFQ